MACELVVLLCVGTYIYYEGESANTFYIVLAGSASEWKFDRVNNKYTLAGLCNEGDSFGELALLNQEKTRDVTVVTDTPASFATVRCEDYLRTVRVGNYVTHKY